MRAAVVLAAGLAAAAGLRAAPQAPGAYAPGAPPPGAHPPEARTPEPESPNAPGGADAAAAVEARDEVAALRASLAGCERDRATLEAELARLRAELEALQRRRAERELAWLEYNRALAALEVDRFVEPFPIDPDFQPATVEPPPSASPEEELRRELAARADEIRVALRALLAAEEVRGIDLLEVGTLRAGAVGPVVFRLLDDRGRLAGGLTAERLRLEGSLTGHTVALVLENGFETRGGERIPFRGGARRIVLPHVDPRPWIDVAPELFPPDERDLPLDDGLWDAEAVRRDLNALLRRDATGGWYRVRALEGVRAGVLLGLHLEGHDASGRLERRLFADRATVEREGDAVALVLEGGVVVRSAERAPFPGGEHRIVLPRARADAWAAAGVPGLAPPPPLRSGAGDERPSAGGSPRAGGG